MTSVEPNHLWLYFNANSKKKEELYIFRGDLYLTTLKLVVAENYQTYHLNVENSLKSGFEVALSIHPSLIIFICLLNMTKLCFVWINLKEKDSQLSC